jgi:lysozyme
MNYDKMIEQIKSDEGEKLTVYRCTEGFNSIGFGRNLDKNGITHDEAQYLLLNDLTRIEIRMVRSNMFIGDHNDARKAVLYNMAYQLGFNGMLKFKKMLTAYYDNDYRTAAEEMLNSKWAVQTPKRAKRLAEQMLTGEWYE